MTKHIVKVGMRFGRLVVVKNLGQAPGERYVKLGCECDCGEYVVKTRNLILTGCGLECRSCINAKLAIRSAQYWDSVRAKLALNAAPDHYKAGTLSRKNGQAKVAPEELSSADASWWLAGWNDCDINLAAQHHE